MGAEIAVEKHEERALPVIAGNSLFAALFVVYYTLSAYGTWPPYVMSKLTRLGAISTFSSNHLLRKKEGRKEARTPSAAGAITVKFDSMQERVGHDVIAFSGKYFYL